jgi:hypothetical protein
MWFVCLLSWAHPDQQLSAMTECLDQIICAATDIDPRNSNDVQVLGSTAAVDSYGVPILKTCFP